MDFETRKKEATAKVMAILAEYNLALDCYMIIRAGRNIPQIEWIDTKPEEKTKTETEAESAPADK